GEASMAGLNLTQKIIQSHLAAGELKAGTEVSLRVDQGLLQDTTGTMGFLQLEELRSEEHTSELQSLRHLVCRLLLEKKNARHGRALMCMPITQQQAARLGLRPMVEQNPSRHATNFTLSIEAADDIATASFPHDRTLI